MYTRSTLASCQAQQKEIADQAHQLNTQAWGLGDQIHELKLQILKEEDDLLQASTWRFRRTKLGFCLDGGRDKDWLELVALIGDSPFHSSFDFPDGTTLYINDGELWLSFENAAAGFDFIKDYGLTVDTCQLISEIQTTEEKLKALQALNKYLP